MFVSSLTMAAAQQVGVEAKIDSVAIMIGEQAHLQLTITARQGAKIVYPHYKRSQYLVPGVEVLDDTKGDTAVVDGYWSVKKILTLTSFDEQLYAIPGITVKVDGKSYKSNPVALKVITCDVDTLNMDKFFPPKSVQDNPFLWAEWMPLIWMTLIVLLLIALGSWVIVRLKQNKPIIAHIRIVKKVPPHKKALDEMNRLKGESHTADYDQKAYYTQLTDTLRQYIRERFGFNAMEMTSSEILENLRSAGDEKMLAELSELFMTADLVKFAKYSALLNEKDMNLLNAINFIDQTKREDAPTEERIEPTLSEEEVRTRKTRVMLNVLLCAIAVAIVGLAGYVIYRVWLLLM